ncbi:MAG: hypothetical protein K8R88_00670 [Armatimonadetes bacterium]|nr:hypothetical protein [Armatimonadota bacterium]
MRGARPKGEGVRAKLTPPSQNPQEPAHNIFVDGGNIFVDGGNILVTLVRSVVAGGNIVVDFARSDEPAGNIHVTLRASDVDIGRNHFPIFPGLGSNWGFWTQNRAFCAVIVDSLEGTPNSAEADANRHESRGNRKLTCRPKVPEN